MKPLDATTVLKAASTDQLLEELFSRFEATVFLGYSTGGSKPQVCIKALRGSAPSVLGLTVMRQRMAERDTLAGLDLPVGW